MTHHNDNGKWKQESFLGAENGPAPAASAHRAMPAGGRDAFPLRATAWTERVAGADGDYGHGSAGLPMGGPLCRFMEA